MDHGNIIMGCWELGFNLSVHVQDLCIPGVIFQGSQNKSIVLSDVMNTISSYNDFYILISLLETIVLYEENILVLDMDFPPPPPLNF